MTLCQSHLKFVIKREYISRANLFDILYSFSQLVHQKNKRWNEWIIITTTTTTTQRTVISIEFVEQAFQLNMNDFIEVY